MGDTIGDLKIEKKEKDNRKVFLENKIRLPDSEVNEEIYWLRWNKTSSEQKSDNNMDRLKMSPNIHKYIKNKKQ